MARPVFVAQAASGRSRSTSISFVMRIGVRGKESFDQIRDLHNEGMTLREIAQRTGFHWRSIAKWVRLSAPAERTAIAPKPSSPNYFLDYLRRRWEAGCIVGRHLFDEIKRRRLRRQLLQLGAIVGEVAMHYRRRAPATVMPTVQAADPTTGWLISPDRQMRLRFASNRAPP